MVNIDKINKIKREEIKDILSNEDVIKYFDSIKVFGSCITDKCREDSDIDLFVSLKEAYINDKDINDSYKDINDSYIQLMLASSSDKDIFYAHEQKGEFNKKLYENMINGIEVLK